MVDPHIEPCVDRHRERAWIDRIEWDLGVEWPPNTQSKAGTNARQSTAILRTDHLVVGLHRVGAASAVPRVAASAWPSCLGAGAGARGAGANMRAEAAEVLAGL